MQLDAWVHVADGRDLELVADAVLRALNPLLERGMNFHLVGHGAPSVLEEPNV